MILKQKRYSLFLLLLMFSKLSTAATFYCRANGNWTTASTWSIVSCSGAAASTIPGAADNVIICAGRTVTMNGAPGSCLSLTVNGTANWTSAANTTTVGAGGLILNNGAVLSGTATGSLNVTGTLTVPSGASVTLGAINFAVTGLSTLSGTLTANSTSGTKNFGNLTINSAGAFSSSSAETYTVSGNLVMNGGSLTGTSTGIFNVAGAFTIAAGTTATIGNIQLSVAGLTSINGTLADNSTGGSNTFANVDLNNGGVFNNTSAETYTVTGNLNTYGGDFAGSQTATFNIGGNFNVVSGVCDMNRLKVVVAGNTVISGTLNVNNVRGAKTFNNFTVVAGGFFNCTVAESFRINGNIQVNGVFNANLGVFTIAGAGKTISGTTVMTFDDITCNGSYTNNASVKLTSSLKGPGTWTQGPGSTVDLGISSGNFSVTTFNASAIGNTVLYSRSGNQNVISPADGSYANVTLSGSGTKSLLNSTTFSGNLLISSGVTLDANNNNLTIAGDFTNNGTFTNFFGLGGVTTLVTMNGTVAQTIGGSSSTAFRNLTVSNSSAIVTGATNFSVSGTFTVGAGATFSPNAIVIVSGTGTLTGNGNVRVTRIAATPDFISQYTISGKTLAGLNVDYIGAGNQNVNTLNYGSLTISTNGTRTVTFPAATVGVSNVFSPTTVTTTYGITGNTINFNGTVSQTVPVFNYNNLTSTLTGARVLAPSGTIGVAGIFTPGTNAYTITGSTIDYNGTAAQNVTAFNYYNLVSSSSGARTLPATGTVGVFSSFTPGTNTYTTTGSTIDFNGNIAETIPAFNYNNLTSSSTGTRTLASTGTVGVAGVFTPGTNAYTVTGSTVNYNGGVAQNVTAFNYYNLTSSSTGSRTLAPAGTIGVFAAFTPGTNAYTVTGSTVNFNGNIAQAVPAFNYYNLTSSSTGTRTLASTGTVGVAGAFTPGTNTYTVTGSTVNFNGTAAQGIPAFNYYNLTSSSTGGRTLAAAGTIGVAAAFTPGTNAYTTTGSTVNYNGTIGQVVQAFNYYNLSSSSTGTRILAPAGTVGVAGAFTPGTNSYTVTGSTVNFNGTVAQSVPAFTYNHLVTSGSAAKTLSGNITANGNLTITSNLDASASSYSVNVKGNWLNNGTFTAQSGTVTFSGTSAQTISGAGSTSFYRLDMNNTSGGVKLTGGSYQLSSVINPLSGNFNTNGQSFTMLSDAVTTARIGQLGSGASLSGNFIVQRYITARDTSFADLCSTVQGTTFNDWDNELPAISYIYTPPFAEPSAYTYDETADAYVAVTASTTPLVTGKGYEVFLAGDYLYASLPNTTMNAIGVPNQGTFNLSSLISNNVQGWNLVGNPYASNISWASVYAASGSASSGLYDFIEMYDYTIGDWAGYTSADGIEIGSAQGFWVYGLPGATSLTLIVQESAKTSTSNSTIKSTVKSGDWFSLKLSDRHSPFAHTFKVKAIAEGENGLDINDLPFHPSPNKATPQLFCSLEGKKINRNVFSSASDNYSIQLEMKVAVNGKFRLEASDFDGLSDYSCVALEDRLTGRYIALRETPVYDVDINSNDDPLRFVLHFSKTDRCETNGFNPFAQVNGGVDVVPSRPGNQLNFHYEEMIPVKVEVLNVLGQDIIPAREMVVSTSSDEIVLPETYSGIYFVKISSEKEVLVKEFFRK